MPFLYVIGPENGPYKVGTATSVEARLSGLQTGNHQELLVHRRYEAKTLSSAEMQRIERRVHKVLKDHNIRGEWFDCDLEAIDHVIKVSHAGLEYAGQGARDRILGTLHGMRSLNEVNRLA